MDVIGYAEAAASAIAVALPEGQSAQTVSLPMLAVLKVFDWRDRHRRTQGKDGFDLGLILRNYLDAGNRERLYVEFPHVITDEFDYEPTSGWLLGHDARATLLQHSLRFDRIVATIDSILARELSPDHALALVSQIKSVLPDQAAKLLASFRAGLLGASKP